MKITLPILLLVCLFAVSHNAVAASKQEGQPSLKDRIYYFQHKLLPKWTHDSDGAFYSDVRSGSLDRVRKSATDIVNKQFSDAIIVRSIEHAERVIIEFPVPSDPPLCYFVAIEKQADGFRYITLEKTEDILGIGANAAMGGWSSDGGHQNFGPRTYTDFESFLAELAEKKKG